MNSEKTNYRITLLALIFFLTMGIQFSHAQVGLPDDPDDTETAPIDGFVGIGIAAAIALAFCKKEN